MLKIKSDAACDEYTTRSDFDQLKKNSLVTLIKNLFWNEL